MGWGRIRIALSFAVALPALGSCGGDDDSLDGQHAEQVGVEFFKRVSAGDEAGACELATDPMRNAPCEKVIDNLRDLRGEVDDPNVSNVAVVEREGTKVAGVLISGPGFDAEAMMLPEGDDWAVDDFNVYYNDSP